MGNKRGGLPKLTGGGPRSWRRDIDDMILDAEPKPAEGEQLNGYACDDCRTVVITKDVHEGVTPMFLACRAKGDPRDPANTCKGQSSSCMYRLEMVAMRLAAWALDGSELPHDERVTAVEAHMRETIAKGWPDPTWEWYMPTMRQVRRMALADPRMAEHHRKGGLGLRQIET